MSDITVKRNFYRQLVDYFNEWLCYQNISFFDWNKPYVYLIDGDLVCPKCHDTNCDIPVIDHKESLEDNKCKSAPIFQGELGALDSCCRCFEFLDDDFEDNNKQWRFHDFLKEFDCIYSDIKSDIELID